MSKPHFHFKSWPMFFISLSILIFSTLANLNRFFEYESEVTLHFWKLVPITFLITFLQTITASYPSHLDIKGAEVVEENEEDFEITWQWKIIKPTQLRLNREYSQVIHLANHNHNHVIILDTKTRYILPTKHYSLKINILFSDFYNCFCASQSYSLHLSHRP